MKQFLSQKHDIKKCGKNSLFVMCSMRRGHKSANVNFEIVKYVVDDYLKNILKEKVDQKVQKWLS